LESLFLSLVLPRVLSHAEVTSRGVRCPHAREEYAAEMVALAWLWFLRLTSQGKDPQQFPTALATFAARAVQDGRRLCGQERARDVLSPRAQRRRRFKVVPLPSSTRRPFGEVYAGSQRRQDAFEERLRDNTRTPPDEQATFRLDFPAWLLTRTDRDRRLIDLLMAGERTGAVADRFGLSPARVSQLRRQFLEDWLRFCGDREPDRPWLPA
jgi:hypothetical protein